jgi:hypothetical protein
LFKHSSQYQGFFFFFFFFADCIDLVLTH